MVGKKNGQRSVSWSQWQTRLWVSQAECALPTSVAATPPVALRQAIGTLG